MQDYKVFIRHLMTLDIHTKELFVSKDDSKIVPESICNPALYPPETDAELHPYWFRSTFYNIDHYEDGRRDSGPYFTELRDLMESAESDIS